MKSLYLLLALAINSFAAGGGISGGGSGGSATNVVLTGDVTKSGGSTVTTLGASGSNSVAAIADSRITLVNTGVVLQAGANITIITNVLGKNYTISSSSGGGSSTMPADWSTNRIKLLVIGDSMSDVGTAQECRSNVWARQMAANRDYSLDLTLLQRGSGGDYISNDVVQWNTRYQSYTNITTSNHLAVFIFKGYNDVANQGLASAKQYFTNLVNLVRSNFVGSAIYVDTVPNYTGAGSQLDLFNIFIRTNTLASTYTIVDLATNTAVVGTDCADNIHPDNTGQTVIYQMNAAALSVVRGMNLTDGINTNRTSKSFRANNVIADGKFYGDGSSLTGISASSTNFPVNFITDTQPTFSATNWANITVSGTNYYIPFYLTSSGGAYVETNGMVEFFDMPINTNPDYTYDWVNGNIMTQNGTAWDTGIGSHYSLLFQSGESDYAYQVDDVPTPSTISLSCWIKIANSGINQMVISLPAHVDGWNAPYLNYGFILADVTTTRTLYFTASIGGTYTAVSANSAFVENTWTHIAGVADGLTLKVYTNGALAGTSVAVGSIAYSETNNLVFGVRGLGTSQDADYLNGRLTLVRVFTNAINATSVSNIWYSEKP